MKRLFNFFKRRKSEHTLDDWLEEEHQRYLSMVTESDMPIWMVDLYY